MKQSDYKVPAARDHTHGVQGETEQAGDIHANHHRQKTKAHSISDRKIEHRHPDKDAADGEDRVRDTDHDGR